MEIMGSYFCKCTLRAIFVFDSLDERDESSELVSENWSKLWRKRGRKANLDWKCVRYTHIFD